MGEFLGTRVKEVDTAAVRTNPDTVGRLAVKACVRDNNLFGSQYDLTIDKIQV